ncbi:phosphopantothenoylcysteine synthetase/decarboxylase [Saccharothrix tamanrassetensis]|uniref:Phosphopantothenoylcysteine synthetase/decarboxylase n=1 Tax=Saccharothrix tamanrassetensis TaxID=1051531 RepID=A0A841CKR2_9PSEU|nr:flavoprotein [Saccharothrix tamanrassetensis]MBB5959092.1 phosphopantothenoylcysteine synthetase/decarboxylase [Saccharothrix tamanrassetensis]
MTRPVLGLVASAGGGVERWLRTGLAEPLARQGWRLAVTLTPTAARWLEPEVARLEALTDLPVRWTSRLPSEPKPHPVPDAFVFAPATLNSIAKLALGIGDNQALTVLSEALGRRAPMVVLAQVGAEQSRHPAYDGHLAVLRAAGVKVVGGGPEEVLGELAGVAPFAAFDKRP